MHVWCALAWLLAACLYVTYSWQESRIAASVGNATQQNVPTPVVTRVRQTWPIRMANKHDGHLKTI